MANLIKQNKLLYEQETFKLNGIGFKVHKEIGRFGREKQYCDLFENFLIAESIPYKRELQVWDMEIDWIFWYMI
jgi:hypothetical protein